MMYKYVCVRACVLADLALEQSISLVSGAVCLDRWTKACLDAAAKAGFSGFGCAHSRWFRWFRLRTPLGKCSMLAPTCMLNEATSEICV